MKEHWIRKVMRHTSNCKLKMLFSVLFAIIGVLGGLLPYYGVYRIVVVLTNETAEISRIVFWVVFCFAGYIGRTVFHTMSTMLSHISAYTILNNIRLKMSERLMGAPLGVVKSEKVGKLKNIIVDRVEIIELPIAHMIPEGFSNLLLAVSVYVYLIVVDYRMALATLITAPIGFAVIGLTLKGYTEKYQNFMKASDHVNSVIVEYSEGIEVIKMFNQSDTSYAKYENAIFEFRKYILEWGKSIMTALSFSMSMLPSTLLGVVPVGILLYQSGSLTPAEFVLCVLLAMGVVPALMNVQTFVNNSKMIEYAVEDADEILNLLQLTDCDEFVDIEDYTVTLENVSFAYKENNKVLKNVNVKLGDSKFTALVGPSGSGKSTIAKLIARFWDVSDGKLCIGGIDIRKIPLKQLSACISFVSQDNFLFDCTLLENIRMGNPESSDDQVVEAAKAARCHEFISELDKGYQTTAGEAGKRLSGGEKQRICIARAILKDAPIVILDEATAYTDPENEWEIQKSISALTKDKMLIVIAHRLTTIKDADKIVLINNGEIQAEDTHDNLLKKSEVYNNMWNALVNSKSWVEERKGV
ncbi:MAG: ABC transporter ATP-binding protein/permease [Clostridia bacterium]|nr:ABC transporter ATP-binding protein/permease [Clostridia bacterium]